MHKRRRINTYKSRREIVSLESKIANETDEKMKDLLIEEKKKLENISIRENSNYGY